MFLSLFFFLLFLFLAFFLGLSLFGILFEPIHPSQQSYQCNHHHPHRAGGIFLANVASELDYFCGYFGSSGGIVRTFGNSTFCVLISWNPEDIRIICQSASETSIVRDWGIQSSLPDSVTRAMSSCPAEQTTTTREPVAGTGKRTMPCTNK